MSNLKLSAVFVDPEASQLVADMKQQTPENQDFSYTELQPGIATTAQHEQFHPLPTFGILPTPAAILRVSLEWRPNFDPVRLAGQVLRRNSLVLILALRAAALSYFLL